MLIGGGGGGEWFNGGRGLMGGGGLNALWWNRAKFSKKPFTFHSIKFSIALCHC